MFRTWLRRWLGVGAGETSAPSAGENVARRLAELEEHVDYLAGALRKLRGRVTGGLRGDPARDGDGSDPVSDAPAAEPTTAFDRQAFYAKLDRDREYGRAVKGS